MTHTPPWRLRNVLLPAVASVWLAVVVLWSSRLVGWYGRQRPDGRLG